MKPKPTVREKGGMKPNKKGEKVRTKDIKKRIKPSDWIIKEAQKIHEETSIDPYFNGNIPEVHEYISAILRYLNKQK